MLYIALGLGAMLLVPLISFLLFITGLSGVVQLLAKAEHTEDDEEEWG
jgi:hypothetical protein